MEYYVFHLFRDNGLKKKNITVALVHSLTKQIEVFRFLAYVKDEIVKVCVCKWHLRSISEYPDRVDAGPAIATALQEGTVITQLHTVT